MDGRLYEAAQTGNIVQLLQLLHEDQHILNAVSLSSSGENPLHVASKARHLNFVTEMIRLKPEFAKELNQDGLSSLHIASAYGDIDMVTELLKMGHHMCCLKGRERMIPLHYAAMKGRLDVIRELVLAYPESAGEGTVQGETALHLALKNNQLEAFGVLVEMLKELKKDSYLNKKDEQGNTVLHLAASRKQREQVVELLLTGDSITPGVIEVNSKNCCGLTPLDVLLMFPSVAGDREIADILQQAGALRARDLVSNSPLSINYQAMGTNPRTSHSSPWNVDHLVEYFKFKSGRDSPSEARNSLLVIAVLLATATYQAGLSPPGGNWQDDAPPYHTAGQSIYGTKNKTTFGVFVFFNSTGFYLSLYMISILTSRFPLHLELQVSMVAIAITYSIAITIVTPNGGLRLILIILTSVLSIAISFIVKWVRLLYRSVRTRREMPLTTDCNG
ncbi:ankyrin repeat-containing protein BDA1-like isoform X1 [Macadamia integrifolia]|uniref:ankyrin repeat-containing protein BDA1-like isoform X1 n=1 Tax=Macadamia integrifolia TaxID=60698 RepID=UPI001C4FBD03|nr:ankyrin repeat-containing protein BDA1-like isoform X1 [Macadamia integrifolia]